MTFIVAVGVAAAFFMLLLHDAAAAGQPQVSITTPVNEAIFASDESVTVRANASGADGAPVVQVSFYAGTQLLAADTSEPWRFTWADPPAGIHALTAVARDANGLESSSTPVLVWVQKELSQNNSLPHSPVIVDVTWAPTETMRVAAQYGSGFQGSDSWTPTWGADGELYTAYGDGNGFRPFVEPSLSLGFAKISGGPDDFVGSNIRSPDEIIQFGEEEDNNGRRGIKNSSMLSINGTLYMWTRNNSAEILSDDEGGMWCRLWWSDDDGANWSQVEWLFQEFGYCVFINFGADYAGARDNYVYIISHDNPHAYREANHYILMRVPKDQIQNRSAYEFFRYMDNGTPVWSSDINNRGSILDHNDRAWRSSVSYNSALGRYLMWQPIIPDDGRDQIAFEGGVAIFDAPEPWGPWTTAYYADDWDIGPGDIGSFPTKWMSADGRTLYLVSSYHDWFVVRKATLSTFPPPSEPTPTPTTTPTPTSTPTATGTATSAPTLTPVNTSTATNTPEATAVPSATVTPTPPEPTPSAEPTSQSAASPTVTPTPQVNTSSTPQPIYVPYVLR